MTVAEVIAELQKHPSDAIVYAERDAGLEEVSDISAYPHPIDGKAAVII